jgi:hypothetical protein
LDPIGAKIGVTKGDLSPWYSVNFRELKRAGLAPFARIYNNSMFALLKAAYPEYKWVPWKFAHTPKKLSDDPNFLKTVVEYVEKELDLLDPEDWYRVSAKQLEELGVLYLLTKGQSLFELMKTLRPAVHWDESQFQIRRRSANRESVKEDSNESVPK